MLIHLLHLLTSRTRYGSLLLVPRHPHNLPIGVLKLLFWHKLDAKSYFPTLTVGYLNLNGKAISQGKGGWSEDVNWGIGLAT